MQKNYNYSLIVIDLTSHKKRLSFTACMCKLHHSYKAIWTPIFGQELPSSRETGNIAVIHMHAVAVMRLVTPPAGSQLLVLSGSHIHSSGNRKNIAKVKKNCSI